MQQSRLPVLLTAVVALGLAPGLAAAATTGTYRGVMPVVKFDVSPPLRELAKLGVVPSSGRNLLADPYSGLEGELGPQDVDPLAQTWLGPVMDIPAPLVSFNGPNNISGVQPPDTIGDVGPNHYVSMTNLSFAVYSKTGTLLLGPLANNTLWSGFGGDCQTDNSGDPVILYDETSDRWMLSQFTASGPTFFNCVALSTSSDPTGSYFRWAFSTGANFPDYPKYGFWPDGLYISTREFAGSSFAGVGAYAVERADLVSGNPTPTVIGFIVPPGGTPYNVGDGLLPSDWDGNLAPPAGSPNYFIGSMDNGGPYGAPQDALTVWEFDADFVTPGNSTFSLATTIPIAAYDTMFAPCSGRSCIPQPGTANRIDILSYRQRPMHRAAYRNFGSHEAIVTNQSVEGVPNMAGMRWWEIRNLSTTPTVFQEGTYVPGSGDNIHRWMGSIAQDSAGNMALGYSVSDATATFPGVRYTGRLATDPAGTMPQGEGTIVNGTGSQTSGQRWGDYSSMNIDPVDDCTFWYTQEWYAANGGNWQTRIGSFKFNECGTPDFTLGATPASQTVCAPADAVYDVSVGQVSGFTNAVTLSATNNPAGTTTDFTPNPVTPPGSSTFTVGDTGSAAPGTYSITLSGAASGSGGHSTAVELVIVDAAPAGPELLLPVNSTSGQPLRPDFEWSPIAGAADYTLEVDDDLAFGSIDYTVTIALTTHTATTDLAPGTVYYWRVRASNACGAGANSAVFRFATAIPGEACSTGAITIPDSGPGSPYPSAVTVSTAATSVPTIQLKINAYSHTFPDDVDVLLVGPGGETLVVMSDVGGGTDVTGINLLLDDAAASLLSDAGPLASGTFRPSNVTAGDAFVAPAPAGPHNNPAPAGSATFTSIFGGSDPNGDWDLFVVDDAGGDTGSIGQWCVVFGAADTMPFLDGFETGDTSRWSAAFP